MGTAEDAAPWGGSSAAVAMAANPLKAHQVGRHRVDRGAGRLCGRHRHSHCSLIADNVRFAGCRIDCFFPRDRRKTWQEISATTILTAGARNAAVSAARKLLRHTERQTTCQ